MDVKLLRKALKEVKDKLDLDYALSKGFMCPTCTYKMIDEKYGKSAKGIYVRWFGKNQEQPPIKDLKQVYISHNLRDDYYECRKKDIVKIFSKYYDVDWDYSIEKSILIIERQNNYNSQYNNYLDRRK